jgi:hypothetical protein
MTSAPVAAASWTTAPPVAPAAACTTTTSPGPIRQARLVSTWAAPVSPGSAPAPTATTVPAASVPGISGSATG